MTPGALSVLLWSGKERSPCSLSSSLPVRLPASAWVLQQAAGLPVQWRSVFLVSRGAGEFDPPSPYPGQISLNDRRGIVGDARVAAATGSLCDQRARP